MTMKNRAGVIVRVDPTFRKKVLFLIPEERSFAKKTRRLNPLLDRLNPKDNRRKLLDNLDEILYGR